MADDGLLSALEAVLMVVDEPVTAAQLAAALEVPEPEVEEALLALRAEYDGGAPGGRVSGGRVRGFELRNLAGGWRIYSRPLHAEAVQRFVMDGQTARLTQAALETLAVVAYRQPVSRARVSAIRGVNVDSVMKTLVQRGLVEEAGTDPESGSMQYRTTAYFLERLGVKDLAELPAISPFLPDLEESTAIYPGR
ncbi:MULTISPECIES: SMC-Scp complex subunit ScpB [Arthrobacter]|uniref:SMC-Scp complex subunit ScpB n=2 Tax=Arthrobacter TaxID=1663 RepID=A0ABU9KNK9_9MICC|nr:SMC-Scp complex subunit ScpB [Arthrobacter sp. YJM1]MDP5228488.1 SMC-Scp complex subunit ScpB [Arthrobacter sp. YJM1]